MIDVILMCLIVAYAQDCTTLHPSLDHFIPKDLLPPDNLFHSNPISLLTTYLLTYNYITLHNNNNTIA
jgi:hypothetical protein